jgi:23S rRNA (uridine2552-2'-O)-methyltransferase
MLPMEPIADMHFIQGDFREASVLTSWPRSWKAPGRPGAVGHGAQPVRHPDGADAARMEHLIESLLSFLKRTSSRPAHCW